jgi:hypothetical protein
MPFPQRIGPTELDTTNATIFTANRPIRLTFFSLTNRAAATRAVTLHLVPVGSTVGNSNYLLGALPLGANDFEPHKVDIPMDAGETLQGFSDVAGVIFIGEYTDEKKTF